MTIELTKEEIALIEEHRAEAAKQAEAAKAEAAEEFAKHKEICDAQNERAAKVYDKWLAVANKLKTADSENLVNMGVEVRETPYTAWVDGHEKRQPIEGLTLVTYYTTLSYNGIDASNGETKTRHIGVSNDGTYRISDGDKDRRFKHALSALKFIRERVEVDKIARARFIEKNALHQEAIALINETYQGPDYKIAITNTPARYNNFQSSFSVATKRGVVCFDARRDLDGKCILKATRADLHMSLDDKAAWVLGK